MILSFGDKATAALYHGAGSRAVRSFPPNVRKTAMRKLDMLNGTSNLKDLRLQP